MSDPFTRTTRECSLLWHSFPEIQAMQVSYLVRKVKEEPTGNTENATRKQFREKIATLSQSQLLRAADTLATIWDGIVGPLCPPTLEPRKSPFPKPFPFRNLDGVKLALLKSISTGTFIDVQFFAYNAISDGLPVDPRPLYTSSIVMKRWGAAITTCKVESSLNPLSSNL